MPRKPSATSPGNLILSHLLDVGGYIESNNVNATLRQATGLSSKQIGNALPRLHKQGLITRKTNGVRTTYIALTEIPTSDPANYGKPTKPKPKRGRPPKSTKPLPPIHLPSLIPLYLGEQVTVVGLFLAGDTIELALSRADDQIVSLTVVIPKE